MIYFIQAGEHGPVKIGVAQNPSARLAALQTGSPTPLRLMAQLHAEGDEQSATLPPAVQALVDAAGDTPLTVVSASDDERADHDARLNEIRERAGHCLWAENAAG